MQDSGLVVLAAVFVPLVIGFAVAVPLLLRDASRLVLHRTVDGYVNEYQRRRAGR